MIGGSPSHGWEMQLFACPLAITFGAIGKNAYPGAGDQC